MTADPATSQYLKTYISERLPTLEQETLDPPGDLTGFTLDQWYAPLRDPAYQG
jgi:hypothetical protein